MFPWEDQTFNKEAFQIVEEGVKVIGREGAIEALVDSKMLGFQAAADVLTPIPKNHLRNYSTIYADLGHLIIIIQSFHC